MRPVVSVRDEPVAPARDNSITCSSMTAQEFDVVVVGSGAAGMVAALAAAHQGLSAVVVEKAPHFGGSTRAVGRRGLDPEQRDPQARRQSRHQRGRAHLSGHDHRRRRAEPRTIDTYLDRGPEMLDFVLREHAAEDVLGAGLLRLLPGGAGRTARAAGRSSRMPFDARILGPDEAGLRPAYGKAPLNVVVSSRTTSGSTSSSATPRGVLRSLKVGARTMWAGCARQEPGRDGHAR